MIVIVPSMKRPQTGFYKGIPGFTRASEEAVLEAASRTAYYWWWNYLRLSPVFWYARHSGLEPVDPQAVLTLAQAGDLTQDNFRHWWQTTGYLLLEEAQRPAKVRLVNEQNLGEFVFYPAGKSVVIEVPLTITQQTIVSQFRQILRQHHEGRALDVLASSQARWRLHTKRMTPAALERGYWILLYRLLYPNIAVWRIGDRLKAAPGLNVRDVERWRFSRQTSPVERMQSTIGRFLYKAQRMVLHAEQGSFPNATKIEPIQYPFGKRNHKAYLAATSAETGADSPWRAWLRENYQHELETRIKMKKRLPSGLAMAEPRFIELWAKFVAGETDLLA